jgi:peptidoglycan/LPS O-acetylase OafA/YrhL
VLASTSPVAPTSLAYRITFAGMVALFTAIWAFGDRWSQNPVTDFFANISYPLYVVHPVLGYALISTLASNRVPTLVAVGITTAAVIVAAWMLHLAVESPTHRLGQRWARVVGYQPGERQQPSSINADSGPADVGPTRYS